MRMRYVILTLLISTLAMTFGLEVKLGVFLPNHTVSDSIDNCPNLVSTQAEGELVLESLKNFRWAGSYSVRYNFSYHDTQCSDLHGPLAATDLHNFNKFNILYGPCCKYVLSPVGRYSKQWKLPIITPGGLAQGFSDRTTFPYLTRIFGSYDKVSEFYKNHLIDKYNWTDISYVYHENLNERKVHGFSSCFRFIESLRSFLDPSPVSRTNLYKFNMEPFDEHLMDNFHWKNIFHGIQSNSRLVLLCASPDAVRDVMLKAVDMGFDNGEYVFINLDLFNRQSNRRLPWFRENDTEINNEKARKIYDYLMTVTLRQPDNENYRSFSAKVKRQVNDQYGDSREANEEANSFVGAFHDAVFLYALALNESLAAGCDSINVTDLTIRMRNRIFEGIAGTVSIDEFGDRNADYSLVDMNADGNFEVVANYYGNNKSYMSVSGRSIRWGGDRTSPPQNKPNCGFDGADCQKELKQVPYSIIIGILVALLVIVSFTSIFYIRRLKTRGRVSRRILENSME